MGKRVLINITLMIFSASVYGQQDAQFTHYMFNALYYNPAFSGTEEETTKITALARTQWLGYNGTFSKGGAPTTEIISLSTPLVKYNSGLGAYIVHDKLGPQKNLQTQASYAYHIKIRNQKISIGVRAGLYAQTIDFGQYRAIDFNDEIIQNKGVETQMNADLAIGVLWTKEKYYVGLSVNHLVKPSFNFGMPFLKNSLVPHYYITGGYFYEMNFDFKCQLMTLVSSDLNQTNINVGGIVYFKNSMYGGLSFRSSEAAILLLGCSLLKDKTLKIGYGLDYVIINQGAKQTTSHEIMLSYDLPVNVGGEKKVIRTPRYRY